MEGRGGGSYFVNYFNRSWEKGCDWDVFEYLGVKIDTKISFEGKMLRKHKFVGG